jgi:hypothetical protein
MFGYVVKYGQVKLSVCYIKHDGMKTYTQVDAQLHTFLTSALDGNVQAEFTHTNTPQSLIIINFQYELPSLYTSVKVRGSH